MKIKKLILLCGCFVALMGGDYEIGMEALKNNDFAKAHEYLSKSCTENNNMKACVELSEYLSKSCKKDNMNACFELGMLNLTINNKENQQIGAEILSALCKNNHADSCRMIANLFVVAGKEEEAFIMYQRVCMLDKEFCNFLAHYYENGLVVRQNVTQAIKYYQESCNAGNNSGCESLQKLYNKK